MPAAQADTPFYAEWWFLLVLALGSLLVLLLAALALLLRGQSRGHRSCGTGEHPPPTPPHSAPRRAGARLCPVPCPPGLQRD